MTIVPGGSPKAIKLTALATLVVMTTEVYSDFMMSWNEELKDIEDKEKRKQKRLRQLLMKSGKLKGRR